MDNLKGLLGRVEGCSGPDRDLDNDLWFALCLPSDWCGKRVMEWHFDKATGWWNCHTDDSVLHLECKLAPRFTSSLDAVLALVEEKLPGWDIEIFRVGGDCCAEIGPKDTFIEQHGSGASLALATLSALLRALIAQQDKSEAS